MKINSFKKFSLGFITAVMPFAHATAPTNPGAMDYTTPYINPQRSCMAEGMVNPVGKDYRYLFSRDCRVVHVLPPPTMPQDIRGKGVNLNACVGLTSMRKSINQLNMILDEATERARNYEKQLATATPEEAARLRVTIDQLNERTVQYRKAIDDSNDSLDRHYSQVSGATFSITMGGNVGQSEINEIRNLNAGNLKQHIKHTQDRIGADGKVTSLSWESEEESSLRPAQIGFSVFSFLYNLPKEAITNGGIISSDIPGLEYLKQDGAHTGTLHVKANGGITGKVVMSLTTACDRTETDAHGDLQLKADTDPMFTVNRTFEVQEMFAQGYKASLKVDKMIHQISTYVTTDTQHGFQKSTVFQPTTDANISDYVDFTWTTEFEDGASTRLADIEAIQKTVAAKLIDDYIENLVSAKILTLPADKAPVEAAHGGYTDEAHRATRCWTDADGGISGAFGGRHRVCEDYTYIVKVWNDGTTTEGIEKLLTLNVTAAETMTINKTVPFYFTTAFVK